MTTTVLSAFFHDLRMALRGLRRAPGLAAGVVLTLGLAIGANAAIFTLLNAVVLRPLPFADAERLIAIFAVEPGSERQPFSIADFLDLKAGARGLEGLVAWGGWSANLTGVDEPVRLQAQWTSAGFLSLVGARPLIGRLPLAAEEAPGAPRVVLLGAGLWRSRFGGDPAVVGRKLILNAEPYEVIGVLPPEFLFLSPGAELLSPLVLETDRRRSARGAGFLRLLGRLRPGTSLDAAAAELDALIGALKLAHPDANPSRQGARVTPLDRQVVGESRRALSLLQAAATFVLLVAAVNVASLLVARASRRRREIAVRAALGARRRDLARHVLAESTLLAALGGALGLPAAWWGARALVALGPANLPRAAEVGVDLTVVAFVLAAAVTTGLAVALLPALQMSRIGPAAGLLAGGRGATSERAGARTRTGMVVVEVALALVLLVGAGLLLRSLLRLQRTDPGFRSDHLLVVQLSLPRARYATPAAITRYAEQLTARLQALPGVADAGAASLNPLTPWRATVQFVVAGRDDVTREQAPLANYRAVGREYFRTLGVPLRSGRSFGSADDADGMPVAMVSETLARRHLAGGALGARLAINDSEPWRTVEVVGVVGDVKHAGLDADGTADIYVPYAQTPPDVAVWLANILCVAVRTEGDPRTIVPAVRREIVALDGDVAASGARTMDEAYAASLAGRRFQALLVELFGLAALSLALVGVYAITAFAVVERTRELGVRAALGADPRQLLRLVVGQAMRPVVGGLLVGSLVALALGRLLSGSLFEVAAHDVPTFTVSALGLALAALLASLVPSRRALRLDPVRALRPD